MITLYYSVTESCFLRLDTSIKTSSCLRMSEEMQTSFLPANCIHLKTLIQSASWKQTSDKHKSMFQIKTTFMNGKKANHNFEEI